MSDIIYSTVKNESTFEYEEKRSRFIGYIKKTESEEEAKEFIKKIKSLNYDARHNCSAYLLKDGYMRYSDDGEPQGTAGIPMLEVIKKSGLVDVCIVVTRYFGGILLGAGGLVRAYSTAAAGALKSAEKADYVSCESFSIESDYSQYDKLVHLLENCGVKIFDTNYSDKITVFGKIHTSKYENLIIKITESFSSKLSLIHISNLHEIL